MATRSRVISRPSSPRRSPSILVPPTSMPIRTPPRWHPQPRLCKCAVQMGRTDGRYKWAVSRLHLGVGRGQNNRLLLSFRFASLAPSSCCRLALASVALAPSAARAQSLHDAPVRLPAGLLPARRGARPACSRSPGWTSGPQIAVWLQDGDGEVRRHADGHQRDLESAGSAIVPAAGTFSPVRSFPTASG